MTTLSIAVMENITAGAFDCSPEGQLAFIAGGGAAGALGGPLGFLGGLFGTTIYSIYKCNPNLR
jgi:hypothetical protein